MDNLNEKYGLSNEELFAHVDHNDLESEKIIAPRYSYWGSVFRIFFKNKVNIFILCVVGLVLFLTYVYPLFTEYDQFVNISNPAAKHLKPLAAMKMFGVSLSYCLGTGSAGQATFDAVWFGARISITLALVCAAINMTIGILLGAVWGFSKRIDMVMTEVYNIIGNILKVFFIIP